MRYGVRYINTVIKN